MSVPGTPPETGGYLEDEGALPPNATPTTDLPPEFGRAGGVPDLFSGVDRPDDRYPQSDVDPTFRLSQTDPRLAPQDQTQEQVPLPRPRSALFNPTPIEQMQPRLQRRDQEGAVDKSILFDPKPIEAIPPKAQLQGGVPDEPQAGNPNSTLGKAVDKALGMEGMHERVNQADIQRYLTTGGAGMNPAKTAWCAAFVNATLKIAGIEGSGSNVATSFLTKGERVVDEPKRGDVVVEPRGREPGQVGGHVGMATGRTRQNAQGGYEFEVVSGNLSNRVGREWVPARATHVRRLGAGGGLPGAQVEVPKVATTTITNEAPMLSLAEQGQKGFVPFNDGAVAAPAVAAPTVHPATGKPVIQNRDSTISTERTITIPGKDGGYVNIPTIVNGKPVPNKTAVALHVAGKNPAVEGPFKTLDEATSAAKTRSASLAVPEPVTVPVAEPVVPPVAATPETEAVVAAPTMTAPAPVGPKLGPVYAPEGTPLDELNRLSQTKPWGSKQGVLRSWKKSQLGPEGSLNEFRGVVPSEMGGVAQPEPEQLLSEDDAYNALEPKFEEPLYVQKAIPFEYEYRNPPPNVVEIEPMPIAETSPMPLPPLPPQEEATITRGPRSSTYQPIASQQRFVYTKHKPVTPEGQLTLDDEGLPTISKMMRDKVASIIGEENLQTADEKVTGIKWMGQGFTSSVGQFMFMIPAMAEAAKAYPYALATGKVHPYDQKQIEWYMRQMAAVDRGSKQLWGLDPNAQPDNIGARLDQIAGESFFPIKGGTAMMSAITFGVRAYFDPHTSAALNPISEAEAATKRLTKAEKREKLLETTDPATGLPYTELPGHLAPGNVYAGALSGPVFATPYPQEDGTIMLVPNASVRLDRNLKGDDAIAQYKRTGLNLGLFDSIESAHKYLEILNSRVTQTVPIASGDAQVKLSDLTMLTVAGAMTIGMAFGPRMYNTFRYGRLQPRLTQDMGRPVESGPPGLMAYTTPRDYLGTVIHDIHAAPKNLLKRSGASPEELARFEIAYANTQGGATNVAQAAVTRGFATTPEFNFQLKNAKPLAELQHADSPEMRQYLYALNTYEQLIQTTKQSVATQGPVPAGVNPKSPNPGPIKINGMTEADAQQAIKNFELNPALKPIADQLKANNRELLRVESGGRWATKTKAEAKEQATTRQYYVDYGEHSPTDSNPFHLSANDMNTRLKALQENAKNGMTVEHFNRVRPGMFVETTAAQLEQFKHWKPNSFVVHEYGKPRYYVTDPLLAGTMRTDPAYFQSASGHQTVLNWFGAPKRVFEIGTTRWLNPTFALVNGPRNQILVKTAAPSADLKSPSSLQAAAEVHRDLIPQITNGLAKSFDSTGLIGRTLGPGPAQAWLQGVGKRWAATYPDSIHAQIQRHGGNYGSAYDRTIASERILNNAMKDATGNFRQFLSSYKNMLGSVHGAPTNATIRKNWYRTQLPQNDPQYLSPNDLVSRARRLTGDPEVQGSMISADNRMIRYHTDNKIDRAIGKGIYAMGATAELGRIITPWLNTTIQGIKGVGRSYMKNPGKFTAGFWTTQLLPAAIGFAWNQSLGRDAQGVSYAEHQMNGLGPYPSMMNQYIGIPGRPAAEGMMIPWRIHELSLFVRWFEIAMDHMFRDPQHSAMEDWRHAWQSWLKVAGDVPYPTIANMALAYSGMQPAQGMVENNTYKKKESPFDQNSGLNVNIELMMRAMGGGVADIAASAATAMIQDENYATKPASGLIEASKRTLQRAPVLRDIFNMAPPIGGDTRAASEMFEYRNVLRKLDEHYRNFGYGGGRKVTSKPASDEGGLIVRGQLGPATPNIAPGLPQPKTTNPLYNEYMDMVHKKITSDVPEKGGMGYKSAMQEYFKTTKELATLRNITTSKLASWKQWLNLEENKELVDFLKKNNVDHTRPTAVINFYQGRRQASMQLMLKMFKSVEQEISGKIGRPFKVKELDPYLKMKDMPAMVPRRDVMELMQGEYYAGTPRPGEQ